MKKVWTILLAALLLTAGCQSKTQPKNTAMDVAIETAEEDVLHPGVAGGWTPAEDYEITEARKAVFDKGTAELDINYAPLAYLGSQVVAGTNHVFLSRGIGLYALIYVYESLQGDVQLMNIAQLPIVPQADGTLTVPEAGLSGGWYYAKDPAFTDEDEAKLEAALQNQVGASYAIVAYVGEQVVAGLNRCLLVQVTPVVPNAQPHYALAYIYTDLQGNSSLTQIIDLDIGAYCTYGA